MSLDDKVDYQAFSGPGGVWTKYEYNGRGMIDWVKHRVGDDETGHDLAKRDYWRDDRNRILAWKRGTDSFYKGMEDGRGSRYGYDDEGQLTAASYRMANPEAAPGVPPGVAVRTDSFLYDQLGNRKEWNRVASRGQWMLMTRRNNGLNQYHSWENDIPWPNPQHWGTGVFYDDNVDPFPSPPWIPPGNGVVMQEGWITGFYNALNQPVGVTTSAWNGSGNWMWFGYDPLRRCVKRWKSTGAAWTPGYNPATYYYYDGWNLVQEGGSNAAVAERVYVHGGRIDEIVASQVSGAWYNHHYDAQGNCILLSSGTSGNGTLLEQYDYDAFGWPYFYSSTGQPLNSSTFGNRFLFTGREWLKDHRLYDYRARMYQPELGRFLQPDPMHFGAGDYNLYRYCHNDPVNKSDAMGLYPALTGWGGGDWIKGSDGLSAWERDHGMPSNRPQAGPDGAGGGGNDNAKLHGAVGKFKSLRRDGKTEISSQEMVDAAFDDGREAGRETAKDFHSDSKGRYNIEHASSEYPEGNHLSKEGPVRGGNSRYSPHADLPYRTDGTHRVIGSHGHGIQSEKGFAQHDISVANGRKGTPFIASLGLAADRGHRVIIYVPTGGGRGSYFHSTDRRNFYSGQ